MKSFEGIKNSKKIEFGDEKGSFVYESLLIFISFCVVLRKVGKLFGRDDFCWKLIH